MVSRGIFFSLLHFRRFGPRFGPHRLLRCPCHSQHVPQNLFFIFFTKPIFPPLRVTAKFSTPLFSPLIIATLFCKLHEPKSHTRFCGHSAHAPVVSPCVSPRFLLVFLFSPQGGAIQFDYDVTEDDLRGGKAYHSSHFAHISNSHFSFTSPDVFLRGQSLPLFAFCPYVTLPFFL